MNSLSFLLFVALAVALCSTAESVSKSEIRGNSENGWFSEIPMLPLVFASSPTLPEGACKRQAQRYLQELKNGTLWAVRMFDSSVKYPEGIIYGHTRHFGNFDECYNVNTRIPSEDGTSDEELNSRYCLVKILYERLNKSPPKPGPLLLDFDPNDSAWEAIEEKGDFRREYRWRLELALCVPSACTAEDVEIALREPLRELGEKNNISIKTTVPTVSCQAKVEEPEFSTAAKVYCSVILLLVFLVCISTYYDVAIKNENDRSSLAGDALLCFSAKRNLKSLTDVNYTHPGLDSIHLVRTGFTCMIILGHRMMQYGGNPTINTEFFEWTYTIPSLMIMFNGTILVDAFFGLGGLLVGYYLLTELDKKKGKLNFAAAIIIRYFRIIPSYIATIAFIAVVLPHIGSGPTWAQRINIESESCAENWWLNLLFINNYINTDKICMFQSWYVAVDYHMYILALFVVYLFWKMPRRQGFIFLAGLIAFGCTIPFFGTYLYGVNSVMMPLPFMNEIREDDYFIHNYIRSYNRIGSYFIGIIAGIVIYDHGRNPWTIKKPWPTILFFLLPVATSFTVENLGFRFFDPNFGEARLYRALYAGLHRTIFSFSIISIVVLLTVGEGLDFLHKVIKPRWVQPFAKLTYGAYLTHSVNQMYDMAVLRTARTLTLHTLFWDWVPDIVYTFFISFIVALLIEGPFRRMEKLLINKRVHDTPKNGKIANGTNGAVNGTAKKDH